MFRKFLVSLLVVDLLLLNVALALVIRKLYFENSSSNVTKDIASTISQDNCGSDCKDYIQQQIAQLGKTLVNTTPTPTQKITQTSQNPANTMSPKVKVRGTTYVPIPGSGSVLQTDWTTVSGTDFYLSRTDYPGLVGVYFEANMHLVNGNGTAYLRLYDLSHNIAVDGSQISTSSQTSTFVGSGMVSFWDGNNHYVVQAKSLTADTTVYESGRLKIITEN